MSFLPSELDSYRYGRVDSVNPLKGSLTTNMSLSPSSSWLPWPPVMNKMLTDGDARVQRKLDEEALHRKRLSSILRYIASMHQVWRSADGTTSHSFVRSIRDSSNASDFFQYERGDDEFLQEDSFCVLFSTNDFRRLLAAEALDGGSSTLWSSPPFSFYACPSSAAPASTATFQSSSSCLGRQIAIPSFNGHNIASTSSASPTRVTDSYDPKRGQGLWLRLTRLGHNAVAEQPGISPIVDKYLKGWLKESAPRGCSTISDLLTIHHLERAPGIPSTVYSIRHQRLIKTFLKQYKQYLKMRLYQQTLEPIYNRLFEWIQQHNENNEELVWGLGHAKFLSPDGQLINGPLLEVLVEVELALDGGLLVKPRQHTGVSLNREVVSALAAADPLAQHSILSQLHRTVGELESNQLSPGQPSTYVTLLKRIAMEISPGGAFLSSSTNLPPSLTTSKNRTHSHAPSSKLIVTEAWCLYSRSKPSSVWARDANTFADHVALPKNVEDELPIATWSLTHGPSKLEDVLQQGHLQRRGSESREGSSSGFQGIANWFSSNFMGHESSETPAEEDSKANEKLVIVPLASSVSQQRIADLLLRQNYPVVLAEGTCNTLFSFLKYTSRLATNIVYIFFARRPPWHRKEPHYLQYCQCLSVPRKTSSCHKQKCQCIECPSRENAQEHTRIVCRCHDERATRDASAPTNRGTSRKPHLNRQLRCGNRKIQSFTTFHS